jgi:hypothetical protein
MTDRDPDPAANPWVPHEESPERMRLFRRLLTGAAALLALLVVLDPFTAGKPYFDVQATPGFSTMLGLASSAAFILVSVVLRALLARREGYYDDE